MFCPQNAHLHFSLGKQWSRRFQTGTPLTTPRSKSREESPRPPSSERELFQGASSSSCLADSEERELSSSSNSPQDSSSSPDPSSSMEFQSKESTRFTPSPQALKLTWPELMFQRLTTPYLRKKRSPREPMRRNS